MKLLNGNLLKKGDIIGIFTPSWPGHSVLRDKYLLGLENLRGLGFKIKEGSVTVKHTNQGYRSGTPNERAEECMK